MDGRTRKFFFFDGSVWDNGTALHPQNTNPGAINVRNGLVWVTDRTTRKTYRRFLGAWDNGKDGPAGATGIVGLGLSEILL